jgi:hypothetical protein
MMIITNQLFNLVRFASTSTNKPQGFEMGDYDTEPPSAQDSLLLRDPMQCYTLDNTPITTDPLAIVIQKYIDILERFGELRKHMSRAKSTPPSEVNWPPINQFDELHQLVKHWSDELPDELKFTEENLELYKKTSSLNYLSFWLTAHLMYHTAIVSLHRGSLAYSELTKNDVRDAVYNPIQNSISACKDSVATAMDVFKNLADICGCNMLPYMGYSAYIFSTVLMTLAFSSDPTSYKKSSEWLAILFGTMEVMYKTHVGKIIKYMGKNSLVVYI